LADKPFSISMVTFLRRKDSSVEIIKIGETTRF